MATSLQSTPTRADMKQQAGMLLQQVAGYVGTRTIQLGLRYPLISSLADAGAGLMPDELAVAADIDPFYAHVWCRRRSPPGSWSVTATGFGWPTMSATCS
jgi:hypothetical protein